MDDFPETDTRARTGLIAVALMGGIMLLGSLVIVAIAMSRDSGSKGSSPSGTSKAHVATAKNPYPECERILAYLKENSGDPRSIEVIRWGKRVVVRGDDGGTAIHIPVKFRGRNAIGGMSVDCLHFAITATEIQGTPTNESDF